jgi:hypothetical protein
LFFNCIQENQVDQTTVLKNREFLVKTKEKQKRMSERSGDIVQSLKTTLPSYVSESRDAASTIHAFVTASGAQQLGSVLVTSAGAVEEGVVELSQNTQQVVRVLNEENRLLRAELLKTWQTASSVAVEKAADVSQQGETNSYDVSDVVKRSLEQVRDYLQSLHENSTTATTDQLSQVVEQLMESNAKLEAEKRVMGLEYVPRSAYDATALRCQRLTAELNAATASRQLAAAQLEEARALANVQSMRLAAPSQEQSSEDNRRSSPGAASSELLSGAAHASVSLLGSANGVWRVAIRQLEEHGAVAVSHKIQSMEVDALRAEITQLHQRNETLVVELKTARQMMQALERDLEVQRSLRQKMQEKLTEALSTQPFSDVPVGPLRSQAIGSSIPLEPSRLPSLQPAQRGQPLGRIAAHDPSSVRGAEEDETLLNISAMSPAPRAVPNAVPAAAGARHCSVEQLIDENQSLYKQVLELQRSDRQLFADSSAGDRKRARSERAPSAEPVTTSDVGTSTDAVIELTSRLPGQNNAGAVPPIVPCQCESLHRCCVRLSSRTTLQYHAWCDKPGACRPNSERSSNRSRSCRSDAIVLETGGFRICGQRSQGVAARAGCGVAQGAARPFDRRSIGSR